MILVSEWVDPKGLELLKQLPYPTSYQPDLWADVEALKAAMGKAHALVVRNRTCVSQELLDAAPQLRVVGRLGVGLDNIDAQSLQQHHVPLVYARGANALAVVEYVLSALLYSARPWLDWTHRTRMGEWKRDLGGQEIHGKILGIVGVGDIGSRVARAARSLGMTVKAYDPHLAPFHALMADGTITSESSLGDLLIQSDALTLHAPARRETRHLLNADTFPLMKPDAHLINTARGSLIDESALEALLKRGHLGQVFLDVRETEPPPTPDTLSLFPNVYLTPHLAGLTEEALARTASLVLEDVMRVLTGRPPQSALRSTP